MGTDHLKRNRPDRIDHYFNCAKVVAERSTCKRRRIGAIVVIDGVQISSGYVGAPRGTKHCIEGAECLRVELKIPSGERYELCRSVHAEQNAIINAARMGISIQGGEMYIYSERIREGYEDPEKKKKKIYGPCMICKKEIVNAGLISVQMREEGVGDDIYTLEKIIKMLQEEEDELRENHRYHKTK